VRLPPLFQDFQDKSLFQFHARGAEKRSGYTGAVRPLFSDNLQGRLAQPANSRTVVCSPSTSGNRNLLRVIHKRFRNHFYQIFHIRLSSETTLKPAATPGASIGREQEDEPISFLAGGSYRSGGTAFFKRSSPLSDKVSTASPAQ